MLDPSSSDSVFVARGCGPCSLCCKVMEVKELAKPKGRWCEHVAPGQGCAIHADRPQICRGFFCAYLSDATLPEIWRPTLSGMVLVHEDAGRRIIAHLDPAEPEAWRREPYYGELKAWARAGKQVAVYIGRRVIVVLPDADSDLGAIGDHEAIGIQIEATPFGRRARAIKVRRR